MVVTSAALTDYIIALAAFHNNLKMDKLATSTAVKMRFENTRERIRKEKKSINSSRKGFPTSTPRKGSSIPASWSL
jgi:hypothetical protein